MYGYAAITLWVISSEDFKIWYVQKAWRK
jgi:hypothetical protein